MGRFVRIKDLVYELGMSKDFWRRMGDQGKVKCTRINKQRVFDFRSCERLLEEGERAIPINRQDTHRAFARRLNEEFRQQGIRLRKAKS